MVPQDLLPRVDANDEEGLGNRLAFNAITTALENVGEPRSIDEFRGPPPKNYAHLMRSSFTKRPWGTSIPVGCEVRILRAGELIDQIGTVLLARSGYYQVKLPGAGDQLIFFRGKELWVTADGDPPPPEEASPAMASRQSVKREAAALLSEADGSNGGDAAAAAGGGDGEQPKWWWQSWVGVEGVRKRKPTQLYDAENGGQSEAFLPEGNVFNAAPRGPDHRPPRRDRFDASESGLVAGAEVLILKRGEYENEVGTVHSMHNGYFQVLVDDGNVINLRAKECQVVNPGESNFTARTREPLRLTHSGLPNAVAADGGSPSGHAPTMYGVGGPTASARPGFGSGVKRDRSTAQTTDFDAYARMIAERKLKRPSGHRSGAHKKVNDINVGNSVTVLRHANYTNMRGKVVASRNGYLIVHLQNGRSAYFRGKDLARIRNANEQEIGGGMEVLNVKPELKNGAASKARKHVNPRGFCGAAAAAPRKAGCSSRDSCRRGAAVRQSISSSRNKRTGMAAPAAAAVGSASPGVTMSSTRFSSRRRRLMSIRTSVRSRCRRRRCRLLYNASRRCL